MKTVQLNTEAVRATVQALGLPQWFIAERAGMHHKTLNGWISGRYKTVFRTRYERFERAVEEIRRELRV